MANVNETQRMRKPKPEATQETIHLNELPAKAKPGPKPKPDSERVINLGICGTQADLDFIATYNNGSATAGFRELA